RRNSFIGGEVGLCGPRTSRKVASLTWREPGDFSIQALPCMVLIDRTTDLLGGVCYGPTQAHLRDKDGQRDGQARRFYRFGVDWSSPENRVHNEASDLAGKLDLAGLDLCQKRAPEGLGRHRPSGLGLRTSWRMCSCGIPRVVKSLTRSQCSGVGTKLFPPARPATPDIRPLLSVKNPSTGLLSAASIADLSSGELYRCSGANIKGLCYENRIFSVGRC